MSRQSTVIARELRQIRASFSRIDLYFRRISPYLVSPPASVIAAAASVAPSRRRPKLSQAQRAALKLQGKYMGTMRGLKPGQRSAIKKIRVEKGIRAAIAEAQKLASGS